MGGGFGLFSDVEMLFGWCNEVAGAIEKGGRFFRRPGDPQRMVRQARFLVLTGQVSGYSLARFCERQCCV